MVTSPQTTTLSSAAWKNAVIVGLGATGFSVARYLFGRGMQVTVVDAQLHPPLAMQLAKIAPGIDIRTGGGDINNLRSADVLIISPGVSLDHPTVRKAQDIGIEIVGDIELFARAVVAPVIGITGSNGKSTVTQWLAVLLRVAGHKVLVGGNIGPPALDLLADELPECYVLELSSFQLESTQSLCLRAGAILNVTPDHLDRYVDLTAYQAAKWRIAKGSQTLVINRQDPFLVQQAANYSGALVTFGLDAPSGPNDLGIIRAHGDDWLTRGDERLISVTEISLIGRHNLANALAAMALALEFTRLTPQALCSGLRAFDGLPHRCEVVGDWRGIRWINDSKGTNVGATIAALEGLDRPVVLIAGGQAKTSDFSGLSSVLSERAIHLVVFGQDAKHIARSVDASIGVTQVERLAQAIDVAAGAAHRGDVILFSPACASYDQFDNFEHRGDVFRQLVKERHA
ncbi:MAG: UDP-N-acetylmuramoyl-L-alanine--D-glutamate ligase [Arenicellales bacterium]|jgi:UDP-N-acetylmuramoylalanine--D-glutamate ligase|nr:UDP-N-acetylmuramoyl-L-alanine--D-glutamate ligase [Arenicellales bacterium]